MMSFSSVPSPSSNTVLLDALQDASKCLSEALAVVVEEESNTASGGGEAENSNNKAILVESPAQQSVGNAADTTTSTNDEDPVMAAWLASQKPPTLDLNDWARIIVAS
eukprot:CAMPEP_0119006934 /NCGR_PEP_ID=MMETSP1176-20130426/2649_1 /TAXON_ID=265551 /ORGANISM="Synedropsis recta cf, Strain CCMP1620" /LENGTH=107 /DNA_ID=CAMNT_0006958971 /DNA_START=37 /DNA_END=360 /DNA_ORIENTATION=-